MERPLLIREFEIENYKSYDILERITLSEGFNVVVGPNNVGKTALLEALELTNTPHPYRSTRQRSELEVRPISFSKGKMETSGLEVRELLGISGSEVDFPISPSVPNGREMECVAQYFNQERILFDFTFDTSRQYINVRRPSNGLEVPESEIQRSVRFRFDRQRGQFSHLSTMAGVHDNFGEVTAKLLAQRIYRFRADRRSVSSSSLQNTLELDSRAENLPSVLDTLQGTYLSAFSQINSLFRMIFPNIHSISVGRVGTDRAEILIWHVDPMVDREGRSRRSLEQCGTGLGQILAMLYILVTAGSPRTIIIDEPNAFLHPGAMRTLFETMKATPHQFIVTTHSPDVITMSEAKTIYIARLEDEQSKLIRLGEDKVQMVRSVLLEVGARLADIFSADRVLWVEGPTEEQCFPHILRRFHPSSVIGTTILALINTGDFDGRRSQKVVAGIYSRLSNAGNLMPTIVSLVFDRENRTDREMGELDRLSSGRVRFTLARMFENYLLDSSAITSVLSKLPTFAEQAVTEQVVGDWIEKKGKLPKYHYGQAFVGEIGGADWQRDVDAAKLLEDLFVELSDAREIYRKIEHGLELTAWILDNRPQLLQPLADWLAEPFGRRE